MCQDEAIYLVHSPVMCNTAINQLFSSCTCTTVCTYLCRGARLSCQDVALAPQPISVSFSHFGPLGRGYSLAHHTTFPHCMERMQICRLWTGMAGLPSPCHAIGQFGLLEKGCATVDDPAFADVEAVGPLPSSLCRQEASTFHSTHFPPTYCDSR